jgi:GR25 family glycosyltransferase involved in LPS biosynthesis
MSEKILDNFFNNFTCNDAINYIKDCKEKKLYNIVNETSKFFLKIFPNNFDLINNIIYSAIQEKNFELASDLFLQISEFNLDDKAIKILWNNLSICIPFIKDRYVFYNRQIVDEITERSKQNNFPIITFTITTCKRYDLFEKTMNSFLNCCKDIHLIDKWFLVDDNSSSEDRERMKKNYPFFEFYFKDISEKGHPRSMNIIRDKVKSPFIFHMEDDWQYIFRKDYITNCLEILSYDESYGQCLINKNYAETETDVNIIGGIPKKTMKGLRYYLHEHCRDEQEYRIFYSKYGNYPNSAYWRHFSFRPSLLKKNILDKLGSFDEKVSHFESEYSGRYYTNGYVSVFLEGVNSLHTGRLTSEINDSTKINAYILNNEKQFSGKEEYISYPKLQNYRAFVINLDRRPDRWKTFENDAKDIGIPYTRFSAIDGQKLMPNDQLQRIFEGNDYYMRRGMVACALSHIKLMIELLYSSYDFFIILEDDITFVPDFAKKVNHLLEKLPDDWDLCYLGHHLWNHTKTDDHFDKEAMPMVVKKNNVESLRYSIGGTTGYLISRQGASRILAFINRLGMTNCIDTMQQKAACAINLYYSFPLLVYSECCTNTDANTDIQKDFNSLDLKRQGDKLLYPERLIKNGKYNIDDAIKIVTNSGSTNSGSTNSNYKVAKIAISETTHVSEALCSDGIYPFDKTDKGNIENFVYFIKTALESKDIKQVANEFINNKFGIEFPHDRVTHDRVTHDRVTHDRVTHDRVTHDSSANLLEIYTKRFENLVKDIKNNDEVVFYHATRFYLSSSNIFRELYDIVKQYNKNVKIISINGIDKNEVLFDDSYLIRRYIDFPEKFINDEWYDEKIIFDQQIFREKIKEVINDINHYH